MCSAKSSICACLLCAIFASVPTSTIGGQVAATTVRYKVIDVGTLPDCDVTFATGVNDAGWVVGYAYTFVAPGHGNSELSRPFVWHDGKLTELAKLGGEYSQALAINSAGDIGGYATTKESSDLPVIWRKSKAYVPETLSKQSGSITCLLDDGTAGGWFWDGKKRRGAIWTNGKLRALGNSTDGEDWVTSVNQKGIAVGYFVPHGSQTQSYMSMGDRHAAMWRDGVQHSLPELTEPSSPDPSRFSRKLSECMSINDSNIAVGWSDGPDGRRACTWEGEKLKALNTPQGYNSEAHSINKVGVIVGEMRERASRTGWKQLACIWNDNKPQDLNKRIPSNSGWNLSVAAQISNRGHIVGIGSYDKFPQHKWRAFLLVPVVQ